MVVKGVDIPEMTEGTHAHRHIETHRDVEISIQIPSSHPSSVFSSPFTVYSILYTVYCIHSSLITVSLPLYSIILDDWKILISKEEIVFARTSPEQKLTIVKVREGCICDLLLRIVIDPHRLFCLIINFKLHLNIFAFWVNYNVHHFSLLSSSFLPSSLFFDVSAYIQSTGVHQSRQRNGYDRRWRERLTRIEASR
jgi:hypothetical protein